MSIISALSRVRFSPEKMQKVNLFENEKFFLDLYCLSPGQQQAAHTHEREDKVYIVLEGAGVVFIDGAGEHKAAAGDALHAPAGELHGLRNDSPSENAVVLAMMAPHPRAAEFASSK